MSLIQNQLAFTVEEYRERIDRLRERMTSRGVEALIVNTPENICYLSGYHSSGYYYLQTLIVTHSRDPMLVLRHYEQRNIDAFSWLDREADGVEFVDTEKPVEKVAAVLVDLGLASATIGIDRQSFFLPVGVFQDLEQLLPDAGFVDSAGLVEAGRRIKSAAEIDHIRTACGLSVKAIRTMVEYARAGITESALAAEVHKTLVANGSEYPGLPVFLSTGWRTEIPHANWSDKQIEAGDTLLCELTGVSRRYAGPLLRCVSIGKPAAEFAHRAGVSAEMLSATIEAMRPGVTSNEVFQAAAKVFDKAGFGSGARRRIGYSVGLNFPPDWGEGYFLDIKGGDETVLEAGMTFHLPTSLRLEGKAGVSISETVLVTEKGCEVLTDFQPRELIVKS